MSLDALLEALAACRAHFSRKQSFRIRWF